MSKEFTYAEVQAHTTKDDLYIVIHEKVYDTSSWVNDHPYVYIYHSAPQLFVSFFPYYLYLPPVLEYSYI